MGNPYITNKTNIFLINYKFLLACLCLRSPPKQELPLCTPSGSHLPRHHRGLPSILQGTTRQPPAGVWDSWRQGSLRPNPRRPAGELPAVCEGDPGHGWRRQGSFPSRRLFLRLSLLRSRDGDSWGIFMATSITEPLDSAGILNVICYLLFINIKVFSKSENDNYGSNSIQMTWILSSLCE